MPNINLDESTVGGFLQAHPQAIQHTLETLTGILNHLSTTTGETGQYEYERLHSLSPDQLTLVHAATAIIAEVAGTYFMHITAHVRLQELEGKHGQEAPLDSDA